MSSILKRTVLGLAVAVACAGASAAVFRLEDAAGKAVQTNPDVLEKWHQFKASLQERNVSWGRYLPTLDVIYGIGREHRDQPSYEDPAGTPADERRYNFRNARARLNQNLFQGFGTINDVKRLEHASMVRFHEMQGLSETAAFEAARAYIDVWRYRQLVSYAEDNYAVHRVMYEKIKERALSGVGRKVDLETAGGRLALAESNLLTETSNLHDVTARFQRVVGSVPPAEMAAPPVALLGRELPADRGAAIGKSFAQSPQLKAAFENILSAMRQVEAQKAGYYPRIDAYAEKGRDKNAGGYGTSASLGGFSSDRTDTTTYGVVATWNLFNGLQDVSRQRKAIEEKYAAKDKRELVCREVRQNASMAFNEHLRLTEQLQYLDQHQLSTDKAREAFRRQFDIGQRTLLDVLDTENEYYTARRNYVNGENDLAVAHARYHAAAGNLVNLLKLRQLDMDPPRPETTPEEDMATTCPAEAVEAVTIDKEAVFRRAQAKEELYRQQMAPAAASEPAAKPNAAQPGKGGSQQ